jgi:hypothetical protein
MRQLMTTLVLRLVKITNILVVRDILLSNQGVAQKKSPSDRIGFSYIKVLSTTISLLLAF